jgi:hypothetical protein
VAARSVIPLQTSLWARNAVVIKTPKRYIRFVHISLATTMVLFATTIFIATRLVAVLFTKPLLSYTHLTFTSFMMSENTPDIESWRLRLAEIMLRTHLPAHKVGMATTISTISETSILEDVLSSVGDGEASFDEEASVDSEASTASQSFTNQVQVSFSILTKAAHSF